MLDAVGELLSRLTKTRADYLDVAISTRLSTAVKTVQYGTVGGGGTATITAVTIGKSVLIHLGMSGVTMNASTNVINMARITLTNSTTVTCTGPGTGETVGFCVVEFW